MSRVLWLVLPELVLCLAAVLIAMIGVGASGPTWPDAPRYTNAAAMFYEWVHSGRFLSPFQFAYENYARYPGFSIPYHPPGVPVMMGTFFLVTGVSYTAARLFTALCMAGCCVLLAVLLRRVGCGRLASLMAAALFLTTPEVARWNRDTMSEIPALLLFLIASLVFVSGYYANRPGRIWIAFALALVAILSRITIIGLLPAWGLFMLLKKDYRKAFSPHILIPAALCLIATFAYMKFASTYARIETEISGLSLHFDQWSFFGFFAGETMVWGTMWIGLLSLVALLFVPRNDGTKLILAWLLSVILFKVMLFTTPEIRHFIFIFPAMAALAAIPLTHFNRTKVQRAIVWSVAVLALGANVMAWSQIPTGVVGYGTTATQLARQEKPGNIFMACWHDQDLIFHYRSLVSRHDRLMIRSDRTFAIRLSDYAERPVKKVVPDVAEALETIRKGRIRYLLTCTSSLPGYDNRPYDFLLAEELVRKHPDQFVNVSESHVAWQFGPGQHRSVVTLWEYTGPMRQGPSELKLVVPTADIILEPTK
ncbi:MAG: glycosyltransferase family 39 protein [Phycisphaeraceae bacterium]